MTRNIYALSVVMTALALVQPALAQQGSRPVGSLEATIAGKPYKGNTLEVPSEGTSTAEFRQMGNMATVSIQAHDPESKRVLHNVLSIEITVMGQGGAASVTPGDIGWWPTGMRGTFYISESTEDETEILLESLSLEGDAHIKGRFSASLCRKDSMFKPADLSDCLPVEGRFDTALREGS